MDKYYAGNVALSVAVQDVCREAGETFGGAAPGLFLNTYERIRCKASEALDNLAKVFDLIWWIDRSGSVQMQKARPPCARCDRDTNCVRLRRFDLAGRALWRCPRRRI
jgi:hypothetical protein